MAKLATKLVKDGDAEVEYAVVREGKVVYQDDDGREELYDVPVIVSKLETTANEREDWKGKAAKYEEALKPWQGKDPAKYDEAIETLGRVSEGKLVEAEAIKKLQEEAFRKKDDEYRDIVTQAQAEKEAALQKARQTGLKALFSELIHAKTGKEGKDPLYSLGLNTAMGVYSPHFVEEGGRWVAYYDPETKQHKVLSKIPEKITDIAEPAEAFRLLVEAHPDKIFHLAGTGASGSGNPPDGHAGRGGATLTRAQLNALPPAAQAEHMANVRAGKAALTD